MRKQNEPTISSFAFFVVLMGCTAVTEPAWVSDISPDGRRLAYVSPDDNQRLFIYDLQTGESTFSRIQGVEQSHPPLLAATDGKPPTGETLAPVMAANGDIAFISRASNLLAGDANETYDVFIWHKADGQVTRVSQGSNGVEANGISGLLLFHEGFNPALDISADGRYLAFAATANLVDITACKDSLPFPAGKLSY